MTTITSVTEMQAWSRAQRAAGRRIAAIDALGHTTQFVFDSAGRPVETVFADGTSTASAFDSNGRLAGRTDQEGTTTNYEYDDLSRLTAVILPEVFLKALSLARNLGNPVRRITAVDLDFNRNYRSRVNIVDRPTRLDGTGYSLVGQHEILVPLLAAGVIEAHENDPTREVDRSQR